jgi:transposase
MAREAFMRGQDGQTSSMFSYVDLEERVPVHHPLRKIREFVNAALAALDEEFAKLYSTDGRPSIAPERLLRAALIQILFSIRSERQLMEQMQYNLLFRWFAGHRIAERDPFRIAMASTTRCGRQPCLRRTATGS